MLTLLKPWRDLQTDLKYPSQTWEEAFNAFCSTASSRDLHIISNIQYFHNCEAAAQCKGIKLAPTQISSVPLEELELDEDVPQPISNERFTEEGLAFFIASQKPWWEELHARPAIKAAKAGGIFDNKRDACSTIPEIRTDGEVDNVLQRGTAANIKKLQSWKRQMEQDVQTFNSVFSDMTLQGQSDDCNTASIERWWLHREA